MSHRFAVSWPHCQGIPTDFEDFDSTSASTPVVELGLSGCAGPMLLDLTQWVNASVVEGVWIDVLRICPELTCLLLQHKSSLKVLIIIVNKLLLSKLV